MDCPPVFLRRVRDRTIVFVLALILAISILPSHTVPHSSNSFLLVLCMTFKYSEYADDGKNNSSCFKCYWRGRKAIGITSLNPLLWESEGAMSLVPDKPEISYVTQLTFGCTSHVRMSLLIKKFGENKCEPRLWFMLPSASSILRRCC